MNSNWTKWIVSSLTKCVNDGRGSLNLHIEGGERPNLDLLELRFIGPTREELSYKLYQIDITIDLLIQSVISPTNIYKLEDNLGVAVSILKGSLPIYQYGDGDALWECLTQESPIKIQRFGQLNPNVKTLLATVSAAYSMRVEE